MGVYHAFEKNETASMFFLKGTPTVYFSSSFYIINQKLMIPRTHFMCEIQQ